MDVSLIKLTLLITVITQFATNSRRNIIGEYIYGESIRFQYRVIFAARAWLSARALSSLYSWKPVFRVYQCPAP